MLWVYRAIINISLEQRGDRIYTSEFDLYRRQILTFKVRTRGDWLVLDRRQRRWANISPSADQCLLFVRLRMRKLDKRAKNRHKYYNVMFYFCIAMGRCFYSIPSKHKTLHNVVPTSLTLYKCYTNVLCLLGRFWSRFGFSIMFFLYIFVFFLRNDQVLLYTI